MIYFDNAATRLPRSESVIAAVKEVATGGYGNPGRGGHGCATRSGELLWRVRAELAHYLEVDPLRILWAGSGTDALNMLIHGLPVETTVWTTAIEHNSVVRPLHVRAVKGELNIRYLPLDTCCCVDADAIPELKNEDLLLLTAGSNVLGGINDLRAIRDKIGPLVRMVVDAAQVAGEINPQRYVPWINGIAAPGHKGIGGPPGTGFLWLDNTISLSPWRQGGTGTGSDRLEQPQDWPDGFEAGSSNLWGIAGLGAAIAELPGLDDSVMWDAWGCIVGRFADLDRIRIISQTKRDKALPLVSFVVEGLDPTSMAWELWTDHEIAVRAGLHCAPGAHRLANTLATGAVRASLGPANTVAEAELFIAAVERLIKKS